MLRDDVLGFFRERMFSAGGQEAVLRSGSISPGRGSVTAFWTRRDKEGSCQAWGAAGAKSREVQSVREAPGVQPGEREDT